MDFYCPLYNQGLYIEKLNQTQAHIGMCCYQHLSKNVYDTVDFVNNDHLTKIRSTATTQPPQECAACWQLEKLNYQSYRQGEILSQQTHNQKIHSTPVLTNLLYNCENVCNLKCIICGPKFSSLWRSDYEQLGYPLRSTLEVKSKTKHNAVFQDLDFTHLENIHFTGGEPFLTNDHKLILTKARNQGVLANIVVSYNTNGTVLPDEEVIDLWKQAKLVKIYFSIDSVGSSYDYVRYPATWQQTEDSIVNGFFGISDPNIIFGVGPTVNISNVFYLKDIINWVEQRIPHNLQHDPTSIYFNPVGALSHGGEVLALDNMSSHLKQQARKYLEDEPRFASVINSLGQRDNTNLPWISYLEKLDQLRGTDWKLSLSALHQQLM